MAQYDVFRLRSGNGLVVSCQSDLIDEFDTRFVIPLLPAEPSTKVIARLTPIFDIEGERYILATQYAASVPIISLSAPIASLAHEHLAISGALDMLISGF